MNCSLFEDDVYINDITVKIPAWLAEGYKELLDNRNIWDWIKYKIYISYYNCSDIISVHQRFNNLLDDNLSSKNTLETMRSIYDLSIFNINSVFAKIDPDQNFRKQDYTPVTIHLTVFFSKVNDCF